MTRRKVLIVDDDLWLLRMVSTVLNARGCQVITASDGKEGYTKALQVRPDLVVTDVLMPGMDGWALVRSLRACADFALVPVIFLTALGADDDRLRGYRLGADDYLTKPFRFEELDLRVANALRRRQEVIDAAAALRRVPAQCGAQGSLDQLGLATLLTMLEIERKSGLLVLRSRGATGRLFTREGHVVAARIDDPGDSDGGGRDTEGAEAVYALLRWSGGTFEWSAIDVEMEDGIGMSVNHLLLEGARRFDEGRRA
ncbi:MAG: response regulator [Myxococcales bacterium]|nr:response regulator [Myxococcales bacterium]